MKQMMRDGGSAVVLLASVLGSLIVPACRWDDPDRPVPRMSNPHAMPMNDDARSGAVVLTPEALRVHRAAILVDGHNDLPWKLREHGESSFDVIDISKPQPQWHTDIPRLVEGGLGAQFWSAYVPVSTIKEGGATRYALEQIDLIHRMVRRYPEVFEMALTADDVVRIRRGGKIACLIGVEGGHAIENSLGVLRMFHDLGVRYLTLAHADTLDWVDSATDEARHGGLTDFGEKVILEMNRLGMLVDISHVSADAMRDVLRVSKAPIIASHSSCYALAEHPRNVPDDVLEKVADNGGVIMVNFFSGFVHPEAACIVQDFFEVIRRLREDHADQAEFEAAWTAWKRDNPIPAGSIHDVVDHIDHIVKVAGVDHAGIGSDFDGVSKLPMQLEDVAAYPYLTQALLDRGYSESDVGKILGGNALRALREAEHVSREWAP